MSITSQTSLRKSRVTFSCKEPLQLPRRSSLDKLNDTQLIQFITEKERELCHLRLENSVFFGYLKSYDPSILEGFENIVSFAQKKSWEQKDSSSFSPRCTVASKRSIKYESFSSVTSVFKGQGPKINLNTKTDMLLRAMEEKQSKLQAFLTKGQRQRLNIKAELKEFSIRETDIKESKESFKYVIMIQSVDPLTQRIPAEKFVRWMEEWLKSADFNIEKLRLRTASLKALYKKVSILLLQRQELRQNLHAVDFDRVQIENKHFAERIEQKTVQLMGLKKMNAHASLVLNNQKKELNKLQQEYNQIKTEIAEKEKTMTDLEQSCEDMYDEVDHAKEKYESFQKLTHSYKVPDVMEYVDIKKQLSELKDTLKIWYRRKKIQDITINACLRHMKNITGSSKIERKWLEDTTAGDGTVETGSNETDSTVW